MYCKKSKKKIVDIKCIIKYILRSSKLKVQNFLAIFVGTLFFASIFVPLGQYHFEGEKYVTGVLWNFMIPLDWLNLILGSILIFHTKFGLVNKKLIFFMIGASLSSFILRF